MSDLATWVDEQVARALEVGSACDPLGGPQATREWDALMREHGVAPLTPDERKKHRDEGPKRRGGAPPIEVRLVVQSIHDRAHAAWHKMDIDDEERRMSRRLSTLVEDAMRDYLARVAPPAPTTASIFANARATTPNYGGSVNAGMNQMKCTSCGAPRKTDGDALVCVYCGGTLR